MSSQRLALCFACDSRYLPAAEVMLVTFLRHNPWFLREGGEVVFIFSSFTAPSDEQWISLQRICPSIRFAAIHHEDKYKALLGNYCSQTWGNPRGISAFFRVELFRLFNQWGYDRIGYLDCDAIVVGSLREVFEPDQPPMKVLIKPDSDWRPKQIKDRDIDVVFRDGFGFHPGPVRRISTGVSSFSREVLEHFSYEELLDYMVSYQGYKLNMEEEAVSDFLQLFTQIPTLYLPVKFCPQTRFLAGRDFKWYRKQDVRLIPFTGRPKPWLCDRREWKGEGWKWDHWWLVRERELGRSLPPSVKCRDLNQLYERRGCPEIAPEE